MAAVPLYADAFPERPALEEALSHALLDRTGLGALPEAMRLAVPGALVSFGRLDALAPGFPAAVAAARERGYAAVHRLVGGRAAVFNGTTVLFAHVAADPEPARGTHDRFRAVSGLVTDALRALGVADPRVGEVPGEYCPGAFSVNAGGRLKLAGIAQRVTQRASCTQGVLVVTGAAEVRAVLEPVYAALGLDWDPATTGAVEDVAPGVTAADAVEALRAAFATRHDLVPAELDAATRARADALAPAHDAEAPVARDPGGAKVAGPTPTGW
jgi:octanoyl-[GcvH]:protein N-octanoyltransferase